MTAEVDVLIVTDDFDGGFLDWTQQAVDRSFHLGEFVKVLRQTDWLGFDLKLTLAHRDGTETGQTLQQIKDRTGADVAGFRFDETFQVGGSNRKIADFDIIFFFSITSFDSADDAKQKSEVDAIARFMEAGGGFFATGDHEDLGFPLCHQIPRVRSMRRWWFSTGPDGEPAAPTATGPNRHDTTQPGPDNVVQFEDQSDEIAQPLDIAWYGAGFGSVGGYPASFSLPHPLLCSPDGAIKWLPDHMHEGQCEVPDNLGGRTFKLDGKTVREYPDYNGEPLAPEVIAEGNILPGHQTTAIDTAAHFNETDPTAGGKFGVIGVWDGHRVGKGRMAVDSTWHHFFNINLTGDLFLTDNLPAADQRLHGFFVLQNGQRVPVAAYQRIRHYYRNLVYWLLPKPKHKPIWWGALADISAKGELKELTKGWLGQLRKLHKGQLPKTLTHSLGPADFDYWYKFGNLADAYFKSIRGACSKAAVREILYKPKIPWWEWVMDIGDPWDPVIQRRNPEVDRFARMGAFGLTARVDSVLQAGVGAAVVLAAQARAASPRGLTEAQVRRLDEAWDRALPAVTERARALMADGAKLASGLDRAMAGKR